MKETTLLSRDPPPAVARGLSSVILASFLLAGVLAFSLKLPETVRAPFVVVTERGGDPLRAPETGRLVELRIEVGQEVEAGEALGRLLSDQRASELAEARLGLASTEARVGFSRERQQEELGAAREELEGLERSVSALERMTEVAERRHAALGRRLERDEGLQASGALADREMEDALLELDRALLELEGLRRELSAARAERSAAEQRLLAARAGAAEEQALLEESVATHDARLSLLQAEGTSESGLVELSAPCAGVVVGMEVRGTGAWLAAGETIAHVACLGEPLVAEVQLPAASAGRVAAGQAVHLRYDAFPYLRYGLHEGEVSWVAPAAVDAVFELRVALSDERFEAAAGSWPVRPGMTGDAEVVIARKPAVAWAFEPLAVLFERDG